MKSKFKNEISSDAWMALAELAEAHGIINAIDKDSLDSDSEQDIIFAKAYIIEAMASIAINDYMAKAYERAKEAKK